MQLARPVCALHPSRFGRGPLRDLARPQVREWTISHDVKLFATTFIAGFVFVSILIG